jgi:hypothetical protein
VLLLLLLLLVVVVTMVPLPLPAELALLTRLLLLLLRTVAGIALPVTALLRAAGTLCLLCRQPLLLFAAQVFLASAALLIVITVNTWRAGAAATSSSITAIYSPVTCLQQLCIMLQLQHIHSDVWLCRAAAAATTGLCGADSVEVSRMLLVLNSFARFRRIGWQLGQGCASVRQSRWGVSKRATASMRKLATHRLFVNQNICITVKSI